MWTSLLLPRWGGREGEGGGLVAARANLLPSPESEIFYAQVAVAMSRTFGPSNLREAGLSLSRTVDAVDAWLERGSIKREEVELMMELAQKNQNLAALAKLGRYHLKHYGLPSRFLYHRTLTIQWFESFSEAIGDAEPPQ